MPDIYWYCPLYCLKCDIDSLKLSDGIEIVKIPKGFSDYLYRTTGRSYYKTPPYNAEWILSVKEPELERPKPTTDSEKNIVESFRIAFESLDLVNRQIKDVVTGLRLMKGGRIIPGLVIQAMYLEDESPSFGGTTSWNELTSLDFFEEEPIYNLTSSDSSTICNIYKSLIEWRKRDVLKKLEIPLYRFHASYLGPIEERIVDQIIAFESLLLGDNQELTYKLSMRTAYLIGNSYDERNSIVNNMKKAYSYRSKIVHGNDPPTRELLRDLIPTIEGYLRNSILKYLNLIADGNTIQKIQTELLDILILKGNH